MPINSQKQTKAKKLPTKARDKASEMTSSPWEEDNAEKIYKNARHKKVSKASRDKAARKRLEKELDSLWGQIAHANVKVCQWPGCTNTERLHAHHYFHQAQGNTARWNTANSIILCYGHHIFQVHQKGDVEPIRDVMIRRLGEDGFNQLKSDVRQVWKPSLDQLEGLKAFFVATLDEFILKETGI